ncbi:MAG TPA: pyruvate formate lyase family protein [Sumerlaeia bacterium]|nr:pyruvate formate lyase family protein [Sumerlaeia bacterium]
MTERVRRLLDQARKRRGIFWLRRRWVAESFKGAEDRPVPIRTAFALENVLRRMPVEIRPGEIIVGRHPESDPPPDAPAYPSLMPDVAPFRSLEEIRAMQAGVFGSGVKTGHLTADYAGLLAEGIGGILRRVEEPFAAPPSRRHFPREDAAPHRDAEREAMAVALRAASRFIERYARLAASLAEKEKSPGQAKEYRAISEACARVAHNPPRNLREALQLVWFAFLIQCIEEGESTAAFALGRFDQCLFPFWDADLRSGARRDDLLEQVACFWVKLNEFSGLQVLNMTIGGSDAAGRDAVNDLSFACLELMEEFQTPAPSLSVRWHPGIDRDFFRKAVQLSTRGIGQPAFYGDPAAIRAMTNAGVAPEDAADVVPGGCVELGVEGCCYPWVGNFFNLPKCLELALHDGVDPETGARLGPATGALDSFEKLFEAYEAQTAYFLDLMANCENTVDRLAGEWAPYPFLSAIVRDCVERGRDVTAGGARYNFTELQGVGIAHVVDSLLNVRRLVYDEGEIGLEELVAKLDANFAEPAAASGGEPLRRRLQLMKPAYGDHTPETADLARRVVHSFFDRVERYTNPRGGTFRPGLLVWTLYHEWADRVGALPDGRRRGDALVSSIGPRVEAVVDSPTSILQDATAFDHFRCAGGLALNLRFTGDVARTGDGLDALMQLMEVYFERGGMQLQVNVVDSEMLRQAQTNPEAYAGLVVRVSGFAARFVTLDRRMQDEIVSRAELSPA